MPELPEVETVRRGISPVLIGQRLRGACVRETRMRWPVPTDLDAHVCDRRVLSVDRRGKYLIVRLDRGALILHLGMSGSLKVVADNAPVAKHDHIDLLIDGGRRIRFRDPRRFGAILYCPDPDTHTLLAHLGIEPLSDAFDGAWLHAATRNRTAAIKPLLMDASLVVGIGNIYANEALFHAGIHPGTQAGRLSRQRCSTLVDAIRATLTRAIATGGSTLRDFVDARGKPGYFQQQYAVYGRIGENCHACGSPIKMLRHGNRATFFCPMCQKR